MGFYLNTISDNIYNLIMSRLKYFSYRLYNTPKYFIFLFLKRITMQIYSAIININMKQCF